LEPPTDNVERFLVMLRFEAREKLKEYPIEQGLRGIILQNPVRVLNFISHTFPRYFEVFTQSHEV
jgi:hypothetical protein